MLNRPVPRFVRLVVSRFLANRGLLLAGGVAWNTLLSLVPLVAVALLAISTVFDQERIVSTLEAELRLVVPNQSQLITGAVVDFLDDRGVVGGVLFGALLFFSSFAFRMLEDAFHFIFYDPDAPVKRRFWVSFILPYGFIFVLTVLLLLLTAASASLDMLASRHATVLGFELAWSTASGWLIRGSGVVGLVLLFSALYSVMPAREVAWRRALVGGLVTTALWEATRRLLVFYFANISVVNVIYGSLATVVVALLTMEVAGVIILLGAQVIALLEQHNDRGLAWHGGPRSSSDQPPIAS